MSLSKVPEDPPDLSTLSLRETTSERSNDPAGAGPPFPWEIWEMILQPLSSRQLLPVRLTCRHLKEIVDASPRTAGKFKTIFGRGLKLDREYEPVHLYAATRVAFWQPVILDIGSGWWDSRLAEGVVQLELRWCSVAFPALMDMLRRAVNLHQLELSDLSYEGVEDTTPPGFVLDKVTELKLSGDSAQWPVLGEICPRLERLSLNCSFDNVNVRNMVLLISAVQETLTDLAVYCAGQDCWMTNFLSEISDLPRLQLSRVGLCWNGINPTQLEAFCRAQPTISDLELKTIRSTDMSMGTLGELGKYLPKLKSLSVSIRFPHIEPWCFIEAMPELEKLIIDYDCPRETHMEVAVASGKSTRLEQIQVFCSKPVLLNGLEQFFINCPNVRSISLNGCQIEGWSNIFVPNNHLKHLQRVQLSNVVVPDGFGARGLSASRKYRIASGEYPNLKQLSMMDCNMKSDDLILLVGSCHVLEEIDFHHVAVTDDVIGSVDLKLLKKITVNRGFIKDRSTEFIQKCCHSLQFLDFRFNNLTHEAKERLRSINSSFLV